MNDWNSVALMLVVALFAVWNMELIAALLNLKSIPTVVPKELSERMDEARLAETREYLTTNARFEIVQSVCSLAGLLAFWFLGGFGWLDTIANHVSHNNLIVGLFYLSAVFIGYVAMGVPFAIYDTFVIEQKFGFNRSTIGTFIGDYFKSAFLAVVIGLPLAAAVLWIFNHVEHAWQWAWAAVTGTQLVLTWLAPTYIMPWFNRFSPMPEGELRDQIQALGQRCGFPIESVFIMDGSKRSSKANAFFTGFGKHKKIALYDTLLEKTTEQEVIAVLAHEIGHFRLGHIRQRLIAGLIQSAVIFYLLGLATTPDGAFSRILFDAFGVATISAHVGLVLFAILVDPAMKMLGLILNAWSRHHEFEADAYATKVCGDGSFLASALKKMSTNHMSHPSPCKLCVWLEYSHPPLIERLRAIAAVRVP